jgi:cold shock CspA family protein
MSNIEKDEGYVKSIHNENDSRGIWGYIQPEDDGKEIPFKNSEFELDVGTKVLFEIAKDRRGVAKIIKIEEEKE